MGRNGGTNVPRRPRATGHGQLDERGVVPALGRGQRQVAVERRGLGRGPGRSGGRKRRLGSGPVEEDRDRWARDSARDRLDRFRSEHLL